MPKFSLDKLVPGESGRIVRIHGRGPIRRRLVDMGLTRGAVIEMVKVSPLGDPAEYRLRDYHLSLRRSEAETILVELLNDHTPHQHYRRGPRSSHSLLRSKSGQRVVIAHSRGRMRLSQKLKGLGLVPGTEIFVIQNDYPGPLIISKRDGNRIILGKGMARHILVHGQEDRQVED